MERILPVISVEGTDFIVDVSKQELIEKANPANTISFLEMNDQGTHYTLEYDTGEKNLPGLFKQGVPVNIPQMVALDPEGMSIHHGVGIEALYGKTDYDIIVNQELVALREKGALPVIEIAGHPFYVDIRMDCLRPKDDFSTMGISFSDIDHCLDEDKMVYEITYNPDTRTFVEVDFNRVTSVPKDLIVVEISYLSTLDPIGYARKRGLDQNSILRANPPIADMKARIVPWSETPIQKIISDNKKREIKPVRRKGRKL